MDFAAFRRALAQLRAASAALEDWVDRAESGEPVVAAADFMSGPPASLVLLPEPESYARVSEVLTKRQVEVTRLLATGATNTEIAEMLVLSPGTVKTHLRQIYRKLHASNRAEAVAKYLRLSALPPRAHG